MTKAGWYPDDATDEVVRYWDGSAWLQEQHWVGDTWVERPLGSPFGAAAAAAAPEPPPPPPPVVAEPPPPPPVVAEPEPPPPPPPPPDAFADVAPPPPPADAVADLAMGEPPPPPDAVAEPEPAPPLPDAVIAATATVVGGPITETVVGAPLPAATTPVDASVAPPPAASVSAAVPPVTTPPPPVAPLPVVVPPPGSGSDGPGWHRPVALVALAVVVAGASGAITYFVRKDDTNEKAVTPVVTVASTRPLRTTSTTSTSTSTTTTTLPGIVPTTTPVLGAVARTCGADGRGDCYVSIRTAPSGVAPEVQKVRDGQAIFVVCQVPGSSVHSSVLDQSSAAWSRTPEGTYAASIFVNVSGFDPLRVSVPCP